MAKSKEMKIAVLDFASTSVDIINVDEEFIMRNYHGDVELFLAYWCDYSIDNIQWIANNKLETNLNMTIDDFAGDNELNEENNETY